jgi:(+)-trans-carveol dehydrogenase
MPGRVEGKVAFITGAARGQGRSHAIRLAEEGADIIAVDALCSIETVPYPMGSEGDLAETVSAVEATGRKIITCVGDVRDQASLDAAAAKGIEEFGHIDIALGNAGILTMDRSWEIAEDKWMTMIDINLNGVWRTTKAVMPQMLAQGSGAIVLTASNAGVRGIPNIAHYNAAKHGVIGLTRTLANEVGPEGIRVNCVAPTNVETPMIINDAVLSIFLPDLDEPTAEAAAPLLADDHMIKLPWVQPVDISNAVLYLCSEEARSVTGTVLHVDMGYTQKV